MEALTILSVGFICLACFLMGAKVGQAVSKGEPIETPTISPLKKFKEMQAKQAAQREEDRIDTILQNIEGYDGTSRGQKDVPR